MSDSYFAPGQAVIVHNNMSTADNLTEKTTLSQEETAFGGKDSSGLNGREAILTTDGGNDTEPEETEEDAVLDEKPKRADKSSPKKRAATKVKEEETSPKKKRAAAKTRVPNERPSTPEVQTLSNEGNLVQANEATPAKKSKATPKPSPTKGKRAGAEKVADKVQLPATWSEASQADRTLVRMKEAGKPWSEIRVKWLEMTGQDTASSTKRLQVIMMELQDGEKETLLAAKEAVEANWKNTMWQAISTKMAEMGSRKLPPDFLCKEFKKMETVGTTGVYAPTAPIAPKGKATASADDKVKDEGSDDGKLKDEGSDDGDADVLLDAAAEALAGGSEEEAPEDEDEEEAAAE
ncbi:MAG: hypothetical protein Q9172_007526 [Xanthocarpia lactea]